MKLFKPTYPDKQTGKTKRSQKWYIAFTDNQRIRRRLPCFSNRAATERAALMLGELLSCGGNLSPLLQGWLEELPAALRGKLASWGLLSSRCRWSASLGKSLAEHLADYLEAMRADGRKETHVRDTGAAVRSILEGCQFRTVSDVDGHSIKVFLAKGRGPDGYGEGTYNHYIVLFKSFINWLWQERRGVGLNPMADVGKMEQTEFRKKRRALTDDEMGRLLAAAGNGPRHRNMSGPERVLCYRLAATTGARANEIRTLTVASFDFSGSPPTVRLEPCDTKGKKAADMILLPDLARDIQAYVQGKLPAGKAFPMPSPRNISKMLRMDLAAAGIPYTDAAGKDVDFHALRHTFITNLSRAGVHPAVAQKLARHSSIELTMHYYTHVLRESEIDAMKRLSDISGLSPACLFGAPQRTSVDAGGRKIGLPEPKTALSA